MQVVREFLDVMSRRSPRLEILRYYTDYMGFAEIVPYCKRWRYLRLLYVRMVTPDEIDKIVHEMKNEMEDELSLSSIYGHTTNDVENLFMQCPSLHCIVDSPERFITCHYSRSSGILRFYSRLDFNALHHKQNISFYWWIRNVSVRLHVISFSCLRLLVIDDCLSNYCSSEVKESSVRNVHLGLTFLKFHNWSEQTQQHNLFTLHSFIFLWAEQSLWPQRWHRCLISIW